MLNWQHLANTWHQLVEVDMRRRHMLDKFFGWWKYLFRRYVVEGVRNFKSETKVYLMGTLSLN